jgi:histidinol-phosphate aminotransferase
MIQTRRAVSLMKPYVPGRLGSGVKLNQNENPLGPSPAALAAASAALAGAARYPDATARALRDALAERWDLPADWFLIGNGSDELFRLLAEAYLEAGDRVVLPTPSFAYYRIVTELMGAEPVSIPLAGGTMDLPAMARAAQAGAKLLFICRPNNPTGGVFPEEAFHQFMSQVPAETLIVLDEAYREFDSTSFESERLIRRYPNLVITRTFSKLYGLAALRLGYGVAQPSIWAPLLTIRDPFSVNAVAAAAGLGALTDQAHIQASLTLVADGKRFLYELCRELNLTYQPSEANFLLIDLGQPSAPIASALEERGVLVRPCASFGLPTAIRVTVGRPEENLAFANELRQELLSRYGIKKKD